MPNRIYKLSRVTVAVIFFYHGLVPKLLFANAQEVMMNEALMPFVSEKAALWSTGILEIIYGILILIFFRSKKILYPAIAFTVLVTPALLIAVPELFQNAFNPLTLNLSVAVLCVINIMAHQEKDAVVAGRNSQNEE